MSVNSRSRRVNSRSRRAAWWKAVIALAVAAVVALVAPAQVIAQRDITTAIAAPEYQSPDGSIRDLWFNRTVEANADLIRIDVWWRDMVGSERPANPRDPGDPAYDFSLLDAAVRGATRRGLEVHFTVFIAPDWAQGANPPDDLIRSGSWRPDPDEYGNFATALARRYSGGYVPSAGAAPLPRVRYFEAWNEPNLKGFLAPVWEGGRPVSPAIYRELLNSFYDAVKGVSPRNIVLGPATSPYGDPGGRTRMRPVLFLRELFCLEGRKKLEPRPGCPPVKLDVLSHHPISLANPPTYSALNPDDAATSDIDRLRRVVRAAGKAGTVGPRRNPPIWATELWWISRPPSTLPEAVSERRQARFLAQALYVLWKQRVRAAFQYLIRDPGPDSRYQTGLFFTDGSEKLASTAFRFPFVTERRSRKRVLAWGISPRAGRVQIQARTRGKWRPVSRSRVRKGKVFTIKLRGSRKMRARIGRETSMVWRN